MNAEIIAIPFIYEFLQSFKYQKKKSLFYLIIILPHIPDARIC